MAMSLPHAIGSQIQIPTYWRRLQWWAEWHGFVIESGNSQFITMRRDFYEGTFSRHSEPERPSVSWTEQ